ncbi:hypothetical protein [Azorhizophilus paspali]|uniref:Uncharacterized protein n=1 Tax=Azorhizophilus paspali TaxID=69963 RepID=A0ABV6SEY2_AZOPA
MGKWDDITADGLMGAVYAAKGKYDPELSRNVIEAFHERMEREGDGFYLSKDVEALCVLMKHVFAQILEGRTADQAFGLKPIKGKHERPSTMDRDMAAAAIVVLGVRRGSTRFAAVADAAVRLGISESVAGKAYDEYREAICLCTDADLEEMAEP